MRRNGVDPRCPECGAATTLRMTRDERDKIRTRSVCTRCLWGRPEDGAKT